MTNDQTTDAGDAPVERMVVGLGGERKDMSMDSTMKAIAEAFAPKHTYTEQDVRLVMLGMDAEIAELRNAAQAVLDAHRRTMMWFGAQMRKQGITSMTLNEVQAEELAAIQKLAEVLKPHNA